MKSATHCISHPVPVPVLCRIATVLLVLTVFTACSESRPDNSDPINTYNAHRIASRKGDWQAVFPLMIPEVKDIITKTWRINRKTARLIELYIPATLKQNYLANIGSESDRNAKSPAEYFEAIMSSIHPLELATGSVLSNVNGMPTRHERVEKGSRNYRITTADGKIVNVILGPDNTYGVEPSSEDKKVFMTNFTDAGNRLADVQSLVESLQKAPAKAPR